jgi:hypothetical protein
VGAGVASGAAVVFFAFVVFAFVAFAAFVAFVFFAFVVVGVVVVVASCANTGIASENATANMNNSVKSFFMLGLDLLMNFFPYLFRARIGPLFHKCTGQRQTTQIPEVMSTPG